MSQHKRKTGDKWARRARAVAYFVVSSLSMLSMVLSIILCISAAYYGLYERHQSLPFLCRFNGTHQLQLFVHDIPESAQVIVYELLLFAAVGGCFVHCLFGVTSEPSSTLPYWVCTALALGVLPFSAVVAYRLVCLLWLADMTECREAIIQRDLSLYRCIEVAFYLLCMQWMCAFAVITIACVLPRERPVTENKNNSHKNTMDDAYLRHTVTPWRYYSHDHCRSTDANTLVGMRTHTRAASVPDHGHSAHPDTVVIGASQVPVVPITPIRTSAYLPPAHPVRLHPDAQYDQPMVTGSRGSLADRMAQAVAGSLVPTRSRPASAYNYYYALPPSEEIPLEPSTTPCNESLTEFPLEPEFPPLVSSSVETKAHKQ